MFDTPGKNEYADQWRAFTTDQVSMDGIEEKLKQTEEQLPSLGPVPQWTLDILAKRRMMRAVRPQLLAMEVGS